MKHEDEIKKYLKKIEHKLTCSKAQKDSLISSLNESIQNYLVEHDAAVPEDIIKKFGYPDEIAESYLASLEPEELVYKVSIKKLHKRIAVIIIILVCCALAGVFVFIYKWEIKNTPVFYSIDFKVGNSASCTQDTYSCSKNGTLS